MGCGFEFAIEGIVALLSTIIVAAHLCVWLFGRGVILAQRVKVAGDVLGHDHIHTLHLVHDLLELAGVYLFEAIIMNNMLLYELQGILQVFRNLFVIIIDVFALSFIVLNNYVVRAVSALGKVLLDDGQAVTHTVAILNDVAVVHHLCERHLSLVLYF